MKKNILTIAIAMVIVAIFYAITFTGAVYLCEASGRELTDNNIQWAALAYVFGLLITADNTLSQGGRRPPPLSYNKELITT